MRYSIYKMYMYITIFFALSSNRHMQPTESCDVALSFPCIHFMVWTPHFLLPNRSLTWKTTNLNCVFISYTSCKDCDYNANYNKTLFYCTNTYENGFFSIFSRGNPLEFSHIVTILHLCKIAEVNSLHVNKKKFSTQKNPDFIHFSGVSCQKCIKMNIEWIRMAMLVLISKPLNRFNDVPCTGKEA